MRNTLPNNSFKYQVGSGIVADSVDYLFSKNKKILQTRLNHKNERLKVSFVLILCNYKLLHIV